MTSLPALEEQLASLGLAGRRVVFHTAFRAVGEVEGGIDGYLSVLTRLCPTVAAPGFTFESTIHPPDDDHPERNGFDYAKRWISPSIPFDPRTASIDPRMGIFPRKLAALPGAARSGHPWNSWVAWGEGAEAMTIPHPWDQPHRPMEWLEAHDGWVALVGVGLESCSALHLAEQRAGRRPFIRWAVDGEGKTRRVRVAGCGNGFPALRDDLHSLFHKGPLGTATVWVAPLRKLIPAAARLLVEMPSLTVCSPTCLKCQDGSAGGPLD